MKFLRYLEPDQWMNQQTGKGDYYGQHQGVVYNNEVFEKCSNHHFTAILFKYN